ncbi:hypothetical protein EBE87_11070 [Pseudoroseomonas wenyumeiae]|uniref:Uncharacterized protein n=1 Tax=Teichococcus wenyumeiae TaxID=2478470 RepID=A0A3A9JDD9_9PROT|nr:hypothetical protein [Pseudoroseomonas wenyumeiae]RKK03421.1 hypothetical protein D6Z83_14590 [Pseudoroseomonas wenyumeiae]RMI25136.1 hypothetical protein EBE87_11070 [Pseudoroseomonas wenyumeiae]
MRLSPSANASLRVLGRFALRLGCITILSIIYYGPQGGTWRPFSHLAFLTAICCVFAAAVTREPRFAGRLTNRDEAAAYAIIGLVARAASLG